MNIKVISENNGPFNNPQLIRQAHVTVDGENFLVSSSNVSGSGIETLAFECDTSGEVLNWTQVAGSWRNGRALTETNTLALTRDLFE
jgi:hypothetical protein